jgi:uncharacterized phosphosugar-binding protein
MADTYEAFSDQVTTRLPILVESAKSGPIAQAIELLADAVAGDGIIRAFGTGHSEAFAMEIAGRAGGLIPTSRLALRDIVLYGRHEVSELADPTLERDPKLAQELFDLHARQPEDIYIIASNSGVNGSIVGVAEQVKAHGHTLIAVTSLDHTMKVTSKHPSGKRLKDFADVTIDNLAPYGDSTLTLESGLVMGAVSSITAAFIGQLLTLGVAENLSARGITPPVYISANVPGGDEHNNVLKAKYAGRLRIDG